MPSPAKHLRNKAKRKWRQQVVDEQQQRCYLCGHRHQLTLHHLIALEDGGENKRENIVGLCRVCHLFWHGFGTGCRDARWEPLDGISVEDGMGVVESVFLFPRRKTIRAISEKRCRSKNKI
jgi:hypothetical protein